MHFARLWKQRGLWARVLFCWAVGLAMPVFDEADNYDRRFRLRGQQTADSQIVLVRFEQADWEVLHGHSENWLRSLREFAAPTDSFFWKASTWDALLKQILKKQARAIGVTFFFSQQLPLPDSSLENLVDPRVIWAGQMDIEGRPMMPLMANSFGYNVASTDLREDEDRVVRRMNISSGPLPAMALKLLETHDGELAQRMNVQTSELPLINFRGGANTYLSISALDVLKGRIPNNFFENKIVLIGNVQLNSHQLQTPLGRMSRMEIIANMTDNAIHSSWVNRSSPWIHAVYFLILLVITALILRTYPQTVAVVFLLWLGLGTSALSLHVFDSYNYWLPAASPLLIMLLAYIILMGYQLALKENQTWRLEQEKQILSELDQLRNNFVSLISHDLKTPIAKIQAICDRLLASHPPLDEEVREGLGSLRKESVELHRYIQGILQVSRLESNSTQLRREATDLNEVVEKVIEQVRPLARDKRQDFLLNLEPMFSIEVDGLLIQEVVLNLVENAVKYTPNDGHIEIKTQEVEDRVVFSVKDTGPGIPTEDRQHIFEKFFRGTAANSQIKGTGLGLFLVKYFVELHGGEVFLESDIGKGTRVGFTLPLEA